MYLYGYYYIENEMRNRIIIESMKYMKTINVSYYIYNLMLTKDNQVALFLN